MVSVVMLSVVMLSVVMINVIMLSVVMLSVVILSVDILTVVMLSVVASKKSRSIILNLLLRLLFSFFIYSTSKSIIDVTMQRPSTNEVCFLLVQLISTNNELIMDVVKPVDITKKYSANKKMKKLV
jgi:hypothetical protein